LLEQTRLSASDLKEIHRGMFGDQAPSAEQLLSRTSHLLSDMSESVGIVISPRPSQERIKHLEFVRLSDGRILVITVSRSGFVQDRLIRIDVDFTQDELDRTARYVNANFSGMSLRAIRGELLRRMSEEKALYDRLLQNAILLCERSFSESGDSSPEVFVEGTSNILLRSDFADTERMRELFRIFEEKSKLVRLLDECVAQAPASPIGVRIGAENGLPGLRGYAVISSSYHDGDQIVGSLGILGPVRMEYARTIGVVNYIARLLEQALNDSPSPANS
jgi:heat-inducible transcriptional repressor